MKQSLISVLVILAALAFYFPHPHAFAETDGQCGNRIISLGERYEDVLSKCGNPDNYSTFVNGFGVQVAIELKYDREKGQYPVYFFFDKRGICTRIRMGSERK